MAEQTLPSRAMTQGSDDEAMAGEDTSEVSLTFASTSLSGTLDPFPANTILHHVGADCTPPKDFENATNSLREKTS